jgi:hypothetical protein
MPAPTVDDGHDFVAAGTASAPPGMKSFCTSITSRQSSAVAMIALSVQRRTRRRDQPLKPALVASSAAAAPPPRFAVAARA